MAARHAPSATYLSGIVEAHRKKAASDTRDPELLLEEAVGSPETRGFRRALERLGTEGLTGVIAEIKRRSPSKGDLAPYLDPAGLAADYERGGATCLSVLTDERFFGGSPSDLRAARGACGLPVLRKDFTVCAADVADARTMGADAVLLIVAALSEPELASLLAIARRLGLDSLVEVHDESELESALACGADLVGVNQRDLETFEVDGELAGRMATLIPDSVVAIAESGIRGPKDVSRLAAFGFQGVLVGESVVTSADPSRTVKALSGHRIAPRQTAGS
jgi:indole-3-glycerol phosphate synthase